MNEWLRVAGQIALVAGIPAVLFIAVGIIARVRWALRFDVSVETDNFIEEV